MSEQKQKPAVEILYCQNCHHERPRRPRDRVNRYGWGPKCSVCKEDHLQLKEPS